MKAHLLSLLLFFPMIACAQVNKCVDPRTGAKYFTERPCPHGTERVKRIQIQAPSSDKANVARINEETAEYRKAKAIEEAIYRGEVIPGMTEDQVIKSRGQPISKNDNGGHIQWVFKNERGGRDYVYFRNGRTY